MTFLKFTRAYHDGAAPPEIFVSPSAVSSFEPGPAGGAVLIVGGTRVAVREEFEAVREALLTVE